MSKEKIDKILSEKKDTAAETSEKKYELEDLRKNCLTLFGVGTSTFDGAISGLTGKRAVSEVKNIIERWKTREVK